MTDTLINDSTVVIEAVVFPKYDDFVSYKNSGVFIMKFY